MLNNKVNEDNQLIENSLPVGWHSYTLSDLAEIKIGGTPKRNQPAYWDTDFHTNNHWVAISDLKQKYISKTKERITNEGVKTSNVKLIPPGTVIMSFKLSLGRLAITQSPLYTNEAIAAFLPKPGVSLDSHFLYYALNTINYDEVVDIAVKGKTLNKQKLALLKIALPEKKEQKKITAILTSVDEAIEQTETIIKQTEKVKIGMMQQLLIKGIGHTEFKNTPLGEVPKDWEVLKLVEIVENKKNAIKPGPFGSSLKKEVYVEKGYKVYGQEQVIPNDFSIGNYFVDQKKFDELKAFEVKPGDLLISLVGTFGKIAIVPENYEPGIINPRLLKISFEKSKASVEFYKHYMSSSPFYNQLSGLSQGGTMGVINSKTLKSLFFPCPPLEEQYKITEILHSLDVKLHTERQKAKSLYLLKKGLMQDLLTGKVRVQVDDPEVVSS